nr:uncharacterized protein LOC111241416 [Ipomoea batatas]
MPTRQTLPPERVARRAVVIVLLKPAQSKLTSIPTPMAALSNSRSAEGACGKHRDEADRTGSEHQNVRLRPDVRPATSVHADAQRLAHRAFLQAHVLRELEAQIRRMHDLVSERSVDRRSCEELHLVAEIVTAFFAMAAPPTANTRLQSHAIAGDEMLHLATDFFNDSGAFMADHHWLFHNKSPLPSGPADQNEKQPRLAAASDSGFFPTSSTLLRFGEFLTTYDAAVNNGMVASDEVRLDPPLMPPPPPKTPIAMKNTNLRHPLLLQ